MMIDEDDIERLLMTRETPVPPANFTLRVMSAVRRDTWQVEQAVDIGFNLAIGAGVFLFVGGLLSLLWSTGLLGFDFDLSALTNAAAQSLTNQVLSQVRTVLVGAALLTTALAIWWWAEADHSS
jgi:hypothetical protein